MRVIEFLVRSAACAALALPSLPAQEAPGMTENMRREMRWVIREEVQAAVRDTLRDARVSAQARAGQSEAGDPDEVGRSKRRRTKQNASRRSGRGARPFVIRRTARGGETEVGIDVVLETDGENVKTFSLPGGQGKVMVLRKGDGDQIEIRVDGKGPHLRHETGHQDVKTLRLHGRKAAAKVMLLRGGDGGEGIGYEALGNCVVSVSCDPHEGRGTGECCRIGVTLPALGECLKILGLDTDSKSTEKKRKKTRGTRY
jgi:hypothetical protein